MRFRAPSETHPHTLELTPARHALRQAIARERARREADAAATVVGRLNAITDEHAAMAIVDSCRTGKTIPIRTRGGWSWLSLNHHARR
jgi:hypothetical protein